MAEKNLTTKDDNAIAGTMAPSDFNAFIGDGFASVETVVFGDGKLNKVPQYAGRLDGPADPVAVGEETVNPLNGVVSRNTMPCWVFKPAGKLGNGSIGIIENVTHIVPCNYMVDAACKRIWEKCQRENLSALVGIIFRGSEAIKGGSRRLNRYQVFEKYTALPKKAA
jgi:hypothetical protein